MEGSLEWLHEQLALGEPYLEDSFVNFSAEEDEDEILIHYLRWQHIPEGKTVNDVRGIVLAHGEGANAYWYAFVAPLLFDMEKGFDIVAVTTSGSGDSMFRKEYDMHWWGAEVISVTDRLGLFAKGRPRPYCFAHSFGGVFMTRTLGAVAPSHVFAGFVVMDSPITPDQNFAKHLQERMDKFKSRGNTENAAIIHPNEESPRSRFVLRPPQPIKHQALVDYIIENSFVRLESGEGWFWKGDSGRLVKLTGRPEYMVLGDVLISIGKQTQCKTAYIYGTESKLAQGERLEYIRAHRKDIPMIAIPGAAHHIFLDHPVATASALHAIMAFWEASPKL